jgi:tripeptide aminopeptidase
VPAINSQRLLDRFLRYVAIDTMAVESTDAYPSSAGQWELGKLLTQQLQQMGAADVEQDAHALVWATIPATAPHAANTIALNAHLDTSPETSGRDVKPRVIRDYSGGDLVLSGDSAEIIRVAANPELEQLHGCTIITSDGSTLLGGDDKAGVAVILETAQYLLEHPELPHGPVRILLTCDEEIGRGVDHVDLQKLNATACYTLDGQGSGEIDVETFSADLATVTVRGVNIHPAIAKDKMINAVKAAGLLLTRLPQESLSPETTEGRQGFLHPYVIEGGVGQVVLKVLLRDFDTAKLADHAQLLRGVAADAEREIKGCEIAVEVRTQYRNMAEGLGREPRAVEFARQAHQQLGRSVQLTNVRGGTDGSRLTEMGLPTPNLSTGQHNPHSPQEWVCLEEMVQAAEVLVEMLKIWAKA